MPHTLCTASPAFRHSFQCSTWGVAVVVCSVSVLQFTSTLSTQESGRKAMGTVDDTRWKTMRTIRL